MTTVHTREQLFQTRSWKTLRRPGTAAEWITGADFDIFTVTGVHLVKALFGICTALIAGNILPLIEILTVVPAATVPLCAVTGGNWDTDVAGTFYGFTGLVTDDLFAGAVIGAQDAAAGTNDWNGGFVVLTTGVINIDNAAASTAGVIDWYITYLPMTPDAVITLL